MQDIIRGMAKVAALAGLGILAITQGAGAKPAVPPVAASVLIARQLRQYTHIHSIEFRADGRFTETEGNKSINFDVKYSYWGKGAEYRIDFRQFKPGADFDVRMTDNGKYFRYFDRIADQLRIMPSDPKHGETPDIQNPLLEPLMCLVPPGARWHWLNLARISRNPRLVLGRCVSVRPYTPPAGKGVWGRCVGSIFGKPVAFTIEMHSQPLGLVKRLWARDGTAGALELHAIHYLAFRLRSGRVLHLPVAYKERGHWAGHRTLVRMSIKHIRINRPIAQSEFTVDYKLAAVVVDEAGNGPWHFIRIGPKLAPPGGW